MTLAKAMRIAAQLRMLKEEARIKRQTAKLFKEQNLQMTEACFARIVKEAMDVLTTKH